MTMRFFCPGRSNLKKVRDLKRFNKNSGGFVLQPGGGGGGGGDLD